MCSFCFFDKYPIEVLYGNLHQIGKLSRTRRLSFIELGIHNLYSDITDLAFQRTAIRLKCNKKDILKDRGEM